MSVLISQAKFSKLTKKEQDLVNRFSYYSQQISDSHHPPSTVKSKSETAHTQACFGNNDYHSLHLIRDSYQHQSMLTRDIVAQMAKLYLKPLTASFLQENAKEKGKSVHQIQNQRADSQSIEFLVVEEKKREDYSEKGFEKKEQSAITISSTSDLSELRNFSVYILHIASETQSWNYFVEKISLQADPFSKLGHSLPLEYEGIVCFPKENWMQQNVMKWFRPSQNNKQIEEILERVKYRLDLFESGLAKILAKSAQNQLHQALNCHPEFKREDRLPAQHYKKFQKIKSEVYAYYASINRNKKLNRYFLDNLVCRFMIFKKYDEKESLEALKDYLNWQKMMRGKYTMQSFKEYEDLGIFKYIGKDFKGRPIVCFRSDKYLPEKIKNEEKYIDYNAYILEIFLQDQMEGYVDQYSILGDYRGFCTDNFKYRIAKEFSEVSNKYFPERQYKLILFGINPFGEWIFKLIKPILPEFIIQKIAIFGSDLQEFKNELKDFMDLSQLPGCILHPESQLAPTNSNTKK